MKARYESLPNKDIACIDMMSFYASCMAALHGLDVQQVPIAVVGDLKRQGSVVLAASPPLKKLGVKTGTRLYEIPKDPRIRLFEPKMEYFIEMSMAISRILYKYAPMESIYVYSIDESFIDLSKTERLWGKPEDTVKRIQYEIYETLHLPSAAGMGPNMLIAKLALDLEAKKTGFVKWTYDDIETKLWPIRPLRKMWGIGSQTEKALNGMGIFSVGDLANYDRTLLEKSFGVLGSQLYNHSWRIDYTDMGAPRANAQVSFGKSQVLLRDYESRESILVILLEIVERIAMRARLAGKAGRTVQLGSGYSKHAFGGGFNRSKSLHEATNKTMALYKVCVELFDRFSVDRPVRNVAISLSNLKKDNSMQLDLFDEEKWRKRKLAAVMDEIRSRYGSMAIMMAVSLTKHGTAIERSKLVGGHKG